MNRECMNHAAMDWMWPRGHHVLTWMRTAEPDI